MANVIVHSMEFCPRCEDLKAFLKAEGIDFSERSLEDTDNIADLAMKGFNITEAPALETGGLVYMSHQLFCPTGKLAKNLIRSVVRNAESI